MNCAWIIAIIGLSLFSTSALSQDSAVSPTIGFWKLSVGGEAHAELLMANPFYKKPIFAGRLATASGNTISFENQSSFSSLQLEGSGYAIEIREGKNPGLVADVESLNGTTVTLKSSVESLVEPGDACNFIPNWTLSDLESSIPLLSGATPETSDLITLLDPRTQEAHAYYAKAGEGWREVGDEAAGDKSQVSFPFYQAFLMLRREARPAIVCFSGRVPYYPRRIQPIHPRRNLIATGLFPSGIDPKSYFYPPGTDPFPVSGGRSAIDSDTVALASVSTTVPRFYYHLEEGWKVVGGRDLQYQPLSPQVPEPFAADYYRAGPEGYLSVTTSRVALEENLVATADSLRSESQVANVAQEPLPTVVAVDFDSRISTTGPKTMIELEWPSQRGDRFMVQYRPTKSDPWEDDGSPLVAQGPVTTTQSAMAGHEGYLRVVQLILN